MRYVLFFAIALISFSCINEVDINLPSNNKTIVLNSILKANCDTVVVWLSYSKPLMTPEIFEQIKDAEIKLYEDNTFIGNFTKSDTTAYLLSFRVKHGGKYRIEAKVGNEKVWAVTKIPTEINVDIISINNNHYSFDYKVSLIDNKNEDNYYWLSAKGFSTYNGKIYPTIAALIYTDFNYTDDFNRIVENGFGYKYEYEYYIRINNNVIKKDSVLCQFYPATIHISNGYQTVVVLSTDYHLDKYMKSSLLMNNIDFYAEEVPIAYSPFPVYSNIHGGTGIFGSLTSISEVFTKD